ncbi:MAG: MBL fold metallo-hydrolase [bacterium]
MKKITAGKFETNTYMINSGDECILIDPGYEIAQYLEEIKKYKVVAVLLTHCHCDHLDGIGMFDCPIYIHELDYPGMTNHCNLYNMLGDIPSFDFKKLNIVKVHGGNTLQISNFSIEVIHTPGHTQGSCCYLHKDVLYTGDTLFQNSIGRTDFPTGDHKILLKSLKQIVDGVDPKTKICPGHGPNSTLKDEKKNNVFVKTL